jgi:choline dehydrogenase-like flavoprotein
MPKTMKSVDAVLIGVGWTGGILARELTKAGLNVVGLERGEFRNTNPDFLTACTTNLPTRSATSSFRIQHATR